MDSTDLQFLKRAIEVAQSARQRGNHPFGAVLVDADRHFLLDAENTVVTEQDCTGHAETNLVRLASKQFTPEELATFTLYASTEPCAMCSGAMFWANIRRVVFALSEARLYEIVGPSPNNLFLPCRDVYSRAPRPHEILGPSAELEIDANEVHAGFWTKQPGHEC